MKFYSLSFLLLPLALIAFGTQVEKQDIVGQAEQSYNETLKPAVENIKNGKAEFTHETEMFIGD